MSQATPESAQTPAPSSPARKTKAPAKAEPDTLLAALARLHERLPAVAKTKTNTYHGNKYADLADVTKALLPVLGECGLVWTTVPTVRPGVGFVLRCTLAHPASGDAIEGDYPLPLPTAKPQDLASAQTYARRVALCAMTNLVAEEDTDGEMTRARSSEPDYGEPIGRARDTLAEGGITGEVISDNGMSPDVAAAVEALLELITEQGWSRERVSARFAREYGHKVKAETDAGVITAFATELHSLPTIELVEATE